MLQPTNLNSGIILYLVNFEQGRHHTSAVGASDIDVICNELITGDIIYDSSFSIVYQAFWNIGIGYK